MFFVSLLPRFFIILGFFLAIISQNANGIPGKRSKSADPTRIKDIKATKFPLHKRNPSDLLPPPFLKSPEFLPLFDATIHSVRRDSLYQRARRSCCSLLPTLPDSSLLRGGASFVPYLLSGASSVSALFSNSPSITHESVSAGVIIASLDASTSSATSATRLGALDTRPTSSATALTVTATGLAAPATGLAAPAAGLAAPAAGLAAPATGLAAPAAGLAAPAAGLAAPTARLAHPAKFTIPTSCLSATGGDSRSLLGPALSCSMFFTRDLTAPDGLGVRFLRLHKETNLYLIKYFSDLIKKRIHLPSIEIQTQNQKFLSELTPEVLGLDLIQILRMQKIIQLREKVELEEEEVTKNLMVDKLKGLVRAIRTNAPALKSEEEEIALLCLSSTHTPSEHKCIFRNLEELKPAFILMTKETQDYTKKEIPLIIEKTVEEQLVVDKIRKIEKEFSSLKPGEYDATLAIIYEDFDIKEEELVGTKIEILEKKIKRIEDRIGRIEHRIKSLESEKRMIIINHIMKSKLELELEEIKSNQLIIAPGFLLNFFQKTLIENLAFPTHFYRDPGIYIDENLSLEASNLAINYFTWSSRLNEFLRSAKDFFKILSEYEGREEYQSLKEYEGREEYENFGDFEEDKAHGTYEDFEDFEDFEEDKAHGTIFLKSKAGAK